MTLISTMTKGDRLLCRPFKWIIANARGVGLLHQSFESLQTFVQYIIIGSLSPSLLR
jgi:hypothetical protein